MNRKRRLIFSLTFIFSTAAVCVLSASLGTEYWIESFPVRLVDNKTQDGAKNVTEGDPGTKFKGYIHYGLFNGVKQMDSGLGIRTDKISVSHETVENGKFSFGLWVSTIVFIALAIVFGLTAMTFSVINAGSKPIEVITGPVGLYVWSGIGIALTLLAMIVYLILFFQDMKDNVMTTEELLQLWTSENRTHLHYSFYFLVVAIFLFGANIVTVSLASVEFKASRIHRNLNGKAMDGVMMY